MLKVGDRLTIEGQLVEVTYVMNEKAFGYKPVKEVEKASDSVEEEKSEEAPKKRRRRA